MSSAATAGAGSRASVEGRAATEAPGVCEAARGIEVGAATQKPKVFAAVQREKAAVQRRKKGEKKEMKRRLRAGEITADEYKEWKEECENEDIDYVESASSTWCYNYERMSTARKRWIARDSARKAAANA